MITHLYDLLSVAGRIFYPPWSIAYLRQSGNAAWHPHSVSACRRRVYKKEIYLHCVYSANRVFGSWVIRIVTSRCMECQRRLATIKPSVCPSVCLSVCLSVKCVDCDKSEERSVEIFIPYARSFSLVFWEEEWLVGATPSTWNFWVKLTPLERNRWFSVDIRS